jgi:hypothetical protein
VSVKQSTDHGAHKQELAIKPANQQAGVPPRSNNVTKKTSGEGTNQTITIGHYILGKLE